MAPDGSFTGGQAARGTRRRVLAVAAAVVLGILIWFLAGTEPGQRVLAAVDALVWVALGCLAGLALVVWVAFFWRARRWIRLACLGLAGASIAAFFGLFRLESFTGSLVPIFVWRWSPRAEDDLQQYLAEREGPFDRFVRQVTAPVDLAETTDHDYPGFLGPKRLGVVANVRLSRDWARRPPRELWRHPVGAGWSAFAVVGQFAVTQEQRGPEESVVCYELRSGVERWAHGDRACFGGTWMHGVGPRATPTIHNGRVYTMGATGLLNCLDGRTGQVVWQQAVLRDPARQNLRWGMAGSPLIVGNTVVVSPGANAGRALVAYDLEDGHEVWAAGDDPGAYASPLLANLGGTDVILVFNGAGLAFHDAASGKRLALFPWVTQGDDRVNIAQPVVLADYGMAVRTPQVLITSGYGEGCSLLEIERSGNLLAPRELWHSSRLRSKLSNVIVCGGYAYGLDEGVMVCLDLRDGGRQWKSGRYGHGQLILAGDLLLVQCESGAVALVEPSPEGLRELGRIPALSSKTWNHAALAGNVLVVRSDRMAAAYELPLAE